MIDMTDEERRLIEAIRNSTCPEKLMKLTRGYVQIFSKGDAPGGTSTVTCADSDGPENTFIDQGPQSPEPNYLTFHRRFTPTPEEASRLWEESCYFDELAYIMPIYDAVFIHMRRRGEEYRMSHKAAILSVFNAGRVAGLRSERERRARKTIPANL